MERIEPVRILLVDDHQVFAEVLAMRMLEDQEISHVDIAASLKEARVRLHRSPHHLILLDFTLADEPGLNLFADLRSMTNPPDVLMLSAAQGTPVVVQSLSAGAQGWVSKTEPFDTLMYAVSEVSSGHMFLAPAALKPVLRSLLAAIAPAGEHTSSFVDTLTPRQLEVLSCFVAGMSRAECAEELYISVDTVRTHAQTMLKRSGLHSTLALAARARELGIAPRVRTHSAPDRPASDR